LTTVKLDCVIKEPKSQADAAVIWLHGLGADGNDFAGIAAQLQPVSASTRFIFPHAPVRPVTINGNMPCRAWFDIYSLTNFKHQDMAGIARAEQSILQLVELQLEQGIKADRIIVAGFSQGGALALSLACRYPKKIAGAIGLSTYLPGASLTTNANNDSLPVFLAHGRADEVLPCFLAKETISVLKQYNCDITWHEYDMAHEVCANEIHDIKSWLQGVFS